MKTPEDNDPVWDLLHQASEVEPSPFFSRNVVREVRKLESDLTWADRLGSFFHSPAGALSAVAVAVLALVVIAISRPDSSTPPAVAENNEEIAPTNFDPANELEAVEYLGQLMAVADPGQLSDEALGDLFF